MTAWLMSVYFNGMNKSEMINYTDSIINTGTKIKWNDLNGFIVDKHSTGGVGDKVSIALAPILAACDCYVPMIVGRALGHTGGTFDKLESIPDYNAMINLSKFKKTVKDVGCSIIGQIPEICPADLKIYNSFLSEYAVLGFDYGYAAAKPKGLTIWEAQFGDFCNGAQIIIDQYISSAEEKWNLQNGLVIYLPHGYEGQGAEHSSGRMERFLQLCAQNNMQVINCTTPANLFHMLRRQIKRSFRKPLILFSPKSLLRHPRCISYLDELSDGSFLEVIDDSKAQKRKVKTLVFTSGKIYYELDSKRDSLKNQKTAILRIEQLYPFPNRNLEKIIAQYNNVNRYIWVQEEPENMGPWFHVMKHFRSVKLKIELISREESAAPASGSYKKFNKRQEEIISKVFKK